MTERQRTARPRRAVERARRARTDEQIATAAWEALYRAQVAVLRQLRAEFPDGDVTVTEYDVLFNLYRQPQRHARIRDLTPQLLLSQPSVSRLIERLAARGLVDRTPDEGDARGSWVGLTDAGVEVFRRVGAQHSAWIAERMSGLTPPELRTLTELTDKLRRG